MNIVALKVLGIIFAILSPIFAGLGGFVIGDTEDPAGLCFGIVAIIMCIGTVLIFACYFGQV